MRVAQSEKQRRWGSAAVAATCLLIVAGVAWSLLQPADGGTTARAAGSQTASTTPADQLGPSGLPLPRFVSLKAEKVNVRRGPSSDHPVAWVFQRKGMPVEIIAESDSWRRIRDSEGEEGWILEAMLSGRRTALVAPWKKGQTTDLRAKASPASGDVARLASGVQVEVAECDGQWCRVTANGYDGYVEQTMLWGVYPGEKLD